MALPVFGAYEGKEGTGTSVVSDSITVSGSDKIGIALIWVADADALSGVLSWNGSAMTAFSGNPLATAGPSYLRAFYIVAPTTGTITGTLGSSRSWALVSAYYTGAKQTGVPDTVASTNDTSSPYTFTLTPTVDECMVVLMGRDNYGTTVTPSTNCTSRGEESSGVFLYDSNTTNPGTSSFSQTVTDVNPAEIAVFQIALAPSVTSVTGGSLATLGVGK